MNTGLADALESRFDGIVGAGTGPEKALIIGRSREGRELVAYRFGRGDTRVSVIAGCHADEPVGPRLLRGLAAHLARLAPDAPELEGVEWWLIPHLNPDGEARNAPWQTPEAAGYGLASYLAGSVREPPGDDIEFGFPRDRHDTGARPEPAAAAAWWGDAAGSFDVHLTLHGMGFAAGPWFLLEPAWIGRAASLMGRCETRVAQLGYELHDVERHGEKGFHRIRRGFTTRPSSDAMRDHFLALGDPGMAARFRPNSMETIRALGGDPLTLVSEMPLFLLPDVGERIGPPDPAADEWSERLDDWRLRLAGGESPRIIDEEARALGLRAMPIRDQMRLQWALVGAAVGLVAGEDDPRPNPR